jgi:hypothetical protein
MTIYILKIQGTSKIPDYVQLRDENLTLIAYFKTGSPKRALEKCSLGNKSDQIMGIVHRLPYGKLEKLEL